MRSEDDLELNAYIDGELSPDQQAELLESMLSDPELARQACELGQLKAQLRLAYADPPKPQRQGVAKVSASWRAIAASFVLLALGLEGFDERVGEPRFRYISFSHCCLRFRHRWLGLGGCW